MKKVKEYNKNIDNLFVRFGKLHLTKQEGFGGETFHSPPSTVGFYAMPFKYQEFYLIGSLTETQSEQINVPKAFKNYGGDDEEIYKKRYEYIKNKKSEIRHEFYVDNDVLVWHHLKSAKRNEIVDEQGSWIKTTVAEYKRLVKKEIILSRASLLGCGGDINSISQKYVCKDVLEVFFDTKVY